MRGAAAAVRGDDPDIFPLNRTDVGLQMKPKILMARAVFPEVIASLQPDFDAEI